MSGLNLRWELADGATIVRRNLTYLRHAPGMLAVIVMAPVAMVVMFGYVFGSAIVVPGNANYREYLIPGLFGMVAVNLIPMMVTMARDVDQGFVDRYRTLPMGRAAVPFGMTGSQIVLGVLSLALMALCGGGGRLAHPRWTGARARRVRAAAALPVRDELGRRIPRTGGRARGDGESTVGAGLPREHGVQRIRVDRWNAGLAARGR